jgi:hypothetical protein
MLISNICLDLQNKRWIFVDSCFRVSVSNFFWIFFNLFKRTSLRTCWSTWFTVYFVRKPSMKKKKKKRGGLWVYLFETGDSNRKKDVRKMLKLLLCLWCVFESASKINRSFSSSHPSSFRIFLVFDSFRFYFDPLLLLFHKTLRDRKEFVSDEFLLELRRWRFSDDKFLRTFYEFESILCYNCWIRFICGGIGTNLWWIEVELNSGNF